MPFLPAQAASSADTSFSGMLELAALRELFWMKQSSSPDPTSFPSELAEAS